MLNQKCPCEFNANSLRYPIILKSIQKNRFGINDFNMFISKF